MFFPENQWLEDEIPAYFPGLYVGFREGSPSKSPHPPILRAFCSVSESCPGFRTTSFTRRLQRKARHLLEAYGLNRSGVMIIRADRDSLRVASFHYSSFAARKKDIAHKLMVHFFRHCVEKKVRYMAGDGNKISILDTLWRQAEGPTNLSVIEASAWQVFVVEHKDRPH